MKHNKFSIFLRKIRKERNEKLKDMAYKVGVSPTYLSAIENSIKPIKDNLVENIIKNYNLNYEKKNELYKSIYLSKECIEFDTKNVSEKVVDFLLVILKKYKYLTYIKIDKMLKILNDENTPLDKKGE